jgi:nucleoside-diphosphate-sugar epimerase
MRTTCAIASIVGVYPPRHVVYGPVSHNGEEYCYLVRGKIFVILISSDNFQVRDSLELVPGKILRIPAGVIHAFLSLEDETVFDLVKTSTNSDEKRFALDDPQLGIKWPESETPLSQNVRINLSSLAPDRPMFAVMGWNGMIGSAFVREMEARKYTFYPIRSRLHQHESIRNELLAIQPTVSVLISAGVGTRPNTRWCETHRMETIDANVTGQLAIAGICDDLKLHLTLIGTCGFYHYDETRTVENGVGFTEEDVPNHECNFYYQMRAYLERLLNECGAIKGILNLRALFPFDHKVTSSSLVGKLLTFAKINSIPSSMTVLPDLVPLALDLMVAKEVGHVNWICDGTASNGDVLRAYQKVVDPNIQINEVIVAPADSKTMGNSAAYVVPKRLIDKFGSDKVPKVKDAIERLMNLIKEERK